MNAYDDIRAGDRVTVRYVVDPKKTAEVRTTELLVLHECVNGWVGQSMGSGWRKTITPTNCEILAVRRDHRP